MKVTHGATLQGVIYDDGIARSAEVFRREDGATRITLKTHWKDDAPPLETTIQLSPEGLSFLSEVVWFAAHDLHRHPVVDREQTI